jgi:DNA polymerase III delta prime subunit
MNTKTSIPWVEKYRPSSISNIVLDSINEEILKNIVSTNTFPNMLFYGPPGTGKTTTAINIINAYQEKYDQTNKGLMIHLNASDERGIDIVRNQISNFVNSSALFSKGLKIIVLDEVDYMTKNAQQALKYLLQESNDNVRFCLICNYISRIDESLQHELLHLRFNCLPVNKIVDFLNKISDNENVGASNESIIAIQRMFKSDIRSMINYMQSNQDNIDTKKIVNEQVWEDFIKIIIKNKNLTQKKFDEIEAVYHIDNINIIKCIINHIIMTKPGCVKKNGFLDFCEFILHLTDTNDEYLRNYFIEHITEWI